MYRHYQWLQAIDKVSETKIALFGSRVEKVMDVFFNVQLVANVVTQANRKRTTAVIRRW
jgi:hypothetical protein